MTVKIPSNTPVSVLRRIEEILNREIPGTPRMSNRQTVGGRVMYVALPGSARKTELLSARAQQVYKFLRRNRKASSKALQSALNVNRNVIAGAVHELKQQKFVRSEALTMQATSAAGKR